MSEEAPGFRRVLAAELALLVLPRALWPRLSRQTIEIPRWQAAAWFAAEMGAMLVYLVRPGWLRWASLRLPRGLRVLGGLLGAGGIALYGWTASTLQRALAPARGQPRRVVLVTWGPYRYVRHPMYAAFFLTGVGFFLLAANALIGLLWVGLVGLYIARRIPVEEAGLVARFGERYRAYAARTPAIAPWGRLLR